MKIKDVEEQTGIERASIRYYEREGLLVTRRNPANGYREYSPQNVRCLEKIIFLRKLGISIEDIRQYQKGETSVYEILKKRKQQIEDEQGELMRQTELSEMLLKAADVNFEMMNIDRYVQQESNRSNSEILGNPGNTFSAVKEVGLVWVIIIVSFLLAVLSLLFLPDRIPIEFVGDLAKREAGKWVMFLFPVLEIFIAVFVKTLILNWLYQNTPMLLIYGEEIAEYLGVWFVAAVCWYQTLLILFTGGYHMNVELVWAVPNLIFLVTGSVLLYLRSHKKERV